MTNSLRCALWHQLKGGTVPEVGTVRVVDLLDKVMNQFNQMAFRRRKLLIHLISERQ